MTTPAPCAVPRVLTDAVEVLRHPARYADRPSLLRLARIVLASATGRAPRQTRLPRPDRAPRPGAKA